MYRIQYAKHRGDPFSIGGLLGGVAKFAGGILPGPAGMVLRAAGGLLGPKPRPAQIGPPISQTQIGPGGMIYKRTEFGAQMTGGPGFQGTGRKRRRMNPLNPRALRRAASRLNSFKTHVKSVSRALGQPVSFGGKRSSSGSRRKCGCK